MMENPASTDPLINKLPDDSLAHIFSFLPILERLKVERVCKRWRIISERGWNDIKEIAIENEYSDNMFHSLLKRCGRFLKKLMIYTAPEQVNYLSMIREFCKLHQLEDFGILIYPEDEKQELHIRDVREIFENSKKLAAVTISGDLVSYGINHLNFLNPEILRELDLEDLSDERLSINPDRFPNLTELNLEHFKISGDEVEREQQSLKGLERINIRNCYIPQYLIQRIKTFTNLQELILEMNICHIKDDHIREIGRQCKKIYRMVLTSSPNLTSDCFQYLGKMPSLKLLYLEHFNNVNRDDISHLENVKELSFHDCSDIINGDGLLKLIAKSSNLKKLKLSFISQLSATFLNDVRQIFDNGQRRKRLTLRIVRASKDEMVGVACELIEHSLLNLILI